MWVNPILTMSSITLMVVDITFTLEGQSSKSSGKAPETGALAVVPGPLSGGVDEAEAEAEAAAAEADTAELDEVAEALG